MKKTLALVTAAGLGAALMTGCEPDEAQGSLDAALEHLDQHDSYVPDADDERTAREYRLEAFDQVRDRLESAARDGRPSEQVAARRLLSEYAYERARHLADQAEAELALLVGRTNTLLTFASAAARAADRSADFEPNGTVRVEQIEQEVRELRQENESLAADIESQQGEVDELASERDQLRDQAQDHYREASQRRADAFEADDAQERFELEEEAAGIEREGDQVDAEADKVDARLGTAEAELSVLQGRAETVERLIDQLEGQLDRTDELTAERLETLSQVQGERDEALDRVREEFEQLNSVYRASVLDVYAEAAEQMREAVDHLRAARGPGGDSGARDTVRMELLGRLLDLVQLEHERAAALARFARPLELAAAQLEAVDADAAEPLTRAYGDFADRQQRVITAAQERAADARELAEQLADLAGDAGERAERRLARAQRLSEQLDALALD